MARTIEQPRTTKKDEKSTRCDTEWRRAKEQYMVLQFAREAEAQVMETIAIASLAPNANGKKAREEAHEKAEAENAPDDHMHAKRSVRRSRPNPQKQRRGRENDDIRGGEAADAGPGTVAEECPMEHMSKKRGGGPRVSTRRPKGVSFCALLGFFRAVAQSFA